MLVRHLAALLLVPTLLAAQPAAQPVAQPAPSVDDAREAMRRAVAFYTNQVATEGGYHFYYAEDLSYGRSEASEGPTQVEYQREGTPLVTLAYLDAYQATKERLFLDAARKAGGAYLRGQLCSGGWDYFVEFEPVKRKQYQYRVDGTCGGERHGVTTLDDNVTQSAIRVLMRLDRALGFRDAAIHEAVRFALDKLVEAQYPIGAWPQRFAGAPDHAGRPVLRASYPETWDRTWPGPVYQQHYTFNDNSISDVIDVMLEAARIYDEPRYLAAAERGGQFILLAQMPEPQPAWAQQYDARMHPAWARVFEPPSVTGGESQGIMRTLLMLHRETGDPKYLEPIPRALAYLKQSVLPPSDRDVDVRRRVTGPVLARFYELQTNRPLYITKGTRMNAAGLGSRLVDGYELSYDDSSVITHYGVLVSGAGLAEIEADYEALLKTPPALRRRPETLTGLSPWAERAGTPPSRAALRAAAAEIIASMDARGAWVTEGTIGKADRLMFVYAARDMVLRIGRGRSDGSAGGGGTGDAQVIRLREDDTVEIFQGDEPPRQRILSSQVFARNLRTLAEYCR
jgi:PelA/Pel-15E family pectate lyase